MNEGTCSTINSAIAHLNGYVLILEKEKNIPALAVKENIKNLKKLKDKEGCK